MPSAVPLSIKSSVRTSSPMNIETSRINSATLEADTAAKYSASKLDRARVFCLRDAEYSGQTSTCLTRLTFCPCHSQPNHCPTRPARTPHAIQSLLQVSRVQLSLTGLSTGIEPIVSVTTMKLSCTCVCLELHITAIDRHVLQASDDSTVECAFL